MGTRTAAMALKTAFVFTPIAVAPTITTAAIKAAMTPYSMAVGALSSPKNFLTAIRNLRHWFPPLMMWKELQHIRRLQGRTWR